MGESSLLQIYSGRPNMLHANAISSSSSSWASIIRAKNVLRNGFSWRAAQALPHFGSAIGALMVYLVLWCLSLTHMTFTSLLEMC